MAPANTDTIASIVSYEYDAIRNKSRQTAQKTSSSEYYFRLNGCSHIYHILHIYVYIAKDYCRTREIELDPSNVKIGDEKFYLRVETAAAICSVERRKEQQKQVSRRIGFWKWRILLGLIWTWSE